MARLGSELEVTQGKLREQKAALSAKEKESKQGETNHTAEKAEMVK